MRYNGYSTVIAWKIGENSYEHRLPTGYDPLFAGLQDSSFAPYKKFCVGNILRKQPIESARISFMNDYKLENRNGY